MPEPPVMTIRIKAIKPSTECTPMDGDHLAYEYISKQVQIVMKVTSSPKML